MESDYSINPGLNVWLGILPPEDEENYDEWEDEEFKVEQKRRVIRIRRSKFRQNF